MKKIILGFLLITSLIHAQSFKDGNYLFRINYTEDLNTTKFDFNNVKEVVLQSSLNLITIRYINGKIEIFNIINKIQIKSEGHSEIGYTVDDNSLFEFSYISGKYFISRTYKNEGGGIVFYVMSYQFY